MREFIKGMLWLVVVIKIDAEVQAWLSIRCVEAHGKFENVGWRDLCVERDKR